jgi:hypothetical protein
MSERPQFSARDMITAPFKDCPKCGRHEFGVHGIHRDRVLRRCRDCWHSHQSKLPPLHKKIIYLDQFVISEFAKLKNPASRGHAAVVANPFWQELYDLLVEVRERQLICCPDSWSHEQESRISGMNADLKSMYEQFSGGITFRNFPEIEMDQVWEMAHAWAENREPVFDFSARAVLSGDPDEWNERFFITVGDNPFLDETEIVSSRQAVHQAIAEIFREKWAVEDRSLEYWYDQERNDQQRLYAIAARQAIVERADAMVAIISGVNPGLGLLEKMMMSPQENLLQGVIDIFGRGENGSVRPREEAAELMRSFAVANRIADAPYNTLEAMMWAVIAGRARGGQREPPNQGMATDIKTVSRLLPYCDAMFVDRECRSVLTNIPSKFKPPMVERVYSMQTRQEFLAYLRGLRDGMSEEHIAGLREAYGDRVVGPVQTPSPEV